MRPTPEAAVARATRVRAAWPLVRGVVHFGWSSGAGLAVDLGVFAVLVHLGSSGFRANIASSSLAITVAYLLVSRFSFRASPTWRTYAVFIGWYAASAAGVSVAIGLISHGDAALALLTKVCTVPLTFCANYLFGRWLFGGGAERTLAGWTPPAWSRVEPLVRFTRRHVLDAVSVGVALWYVALIVPVSEKHAFAPGTPPIEFVVTFVIGLAAAVRLGIHLVARVRAGSIRHRRWATIAGAVLGLNLVLLVLTWPGYWVWDEFGVMNAVRTYSSWAWQGYLTNAYYTVCLFLIPTSAGVVLVQMVFAALVSGYLISALQSRLSRPRWGWFCAIPLLAAPTLLNDLYPLRLTAYAYLLALVLGRFLLLATSPDRRATPAAIIGIGVASAILAFWRTEGVFLLVLLPLYAAVGGRPLLRRRPVAAAVVALACVAVIVSAARATAATAIPAYQATAYINPLSTMLQRPLTSPALATDLRQIDRVIPVTALRRYPSYTESPAFWAVGLRPGGELHVDGMRSAYIDLVLHNPAPFLANRWDALLAANSLQPDFLPQVMNGGAFDPAPPESTAFQALIAQDHLAAPFDPPLRTGTLRVLLLTPTVGSSPLGAAVSDALPILAGVFLVLLVALRRRAFAFAAVALTVLAQAGAVFLTEPAAYFMYYFPAYLCGGLVVTAAVAVVLDRRSRHRTARVGVGLPAVVGVSAPDLELVDA